MTDQDVQYLLETSVSIIKGGIDNENAFWLLG